MMVQTITLSVVEEHVDGWEESGAILVPTSNLWYIEESALACPDAAALALLDGVSLNTVIHLKGGKTFYARETIETISLKLRGRY